MQKAESCRRTRTEGPEQAFDGSGDGPGPAWSARFRWSGLADPLPLPHLPPLPSCRYAVPCLARPCHVMPACCCAAVPQLARNCQHSALQCIAVHCSAVHAAVVMPCRCCTWQAINRHAVLPYDHITAQRQHNAVLCYAVPQQQEKHCLQFLAMHHAAAVN